MEVPVAGLLLDHSRLLQQVVVDVAADRVACSGQKVSMPSGAVGGGGMARRRGK
jgi:hypothetical protein